MIISSTGRLQINLAALTANWQTLQATMASGSHCAAVVKANAYGLGVVPVVKALQAVGCQTFFVATLDEAVELRKAVGFDCQIIVLSGIAHGLGDEWRQLSLVPVLFDVAHIEQWRQLCRQSGQALPCVLKVDTGMHRLGMSAEELLAVVSGLGDGSYLSPIMVMSHLACADTPAHELNQHQLHAFQSLAVKIREYFPDIAASLCNSSGIFLGESYHFDVCRPGIALYGGNPQSDVNNVMQPVVSLQLPVMQVKTIHAGESVGYGATFTADRETRLAIVFGGYADGIFRCLSNSTQGWVGDMQVPLVGRVSMDSLVFDITELPQLPDAIELLNDRQGVDQLALAAGTIAYEVLTALGSRYRRHYVNSGLQI